MKIKTFTASLLCGLLVTFSSCKTTTIEEDAKTASELACKSLELLSETIKNPTDKELLAKAEKLQKEAEALEKKMKEKYSSDEDQAKFGKLVMENIDKDCDAKPDFGNFDLDEFNMDEDDDADYNDDIHFEDEEDDFDTIN